MMILASLPALTQAGHFTITGPEFIAPYTGSGTYSASVGANKATWDYSALVQVTRPRKNPPATSLTGDSNVGGTVRWTVTWVRDSPTETQPTHTGAIVQVWGHIYTECRTQNLAPTATQCVSHAAVGDTSLFQCSSAASSAYGVSDFDNDGSLTDSHIRDFIFDANDPTKAINLDGNGVGYVVVGINGAVHVDATYNASPGSEGGATALGEGHGEMSLIAVGP